MNRIAMVIVSLLPVLMLTGAATNYASSMRSDQTFSQRWQELAQALPAHPKTTPAKSAQKPQPKLPVGIEQALYLIRSTLLTLNDANRSGNYTVLRDLAAPGFQAKNSPADLAQIFADLRNRRFDLVAVALAAPQLSTPPHLENNGMLRLTGHFPTRPLQINFDLLFENVGRQWRLFGISVQTPQAPPLPQAVGPIKR